MNFDSQKEITKLWKALHTAQSEIGKNYFRWRQVAIKLLKNKNIKPIEIGLKAAEFCGEDVSKSLLSKLNWLKGEKGFLENLAKTIANIWIIDGGVAEIEKSEKKSEIFVKCTRDPWPTWAKEYDVTMEEVHLCREKFLKSILTNISIFFRIPLGIKIQKSIPKGHGFWLIKIYKDNK